MTNQKVFLIIFLIVLIPTIYAYLEHGMAESNAYKKHIGKGNDYKATKALVESIFFNSIAIGYTFFGLWILLFPNSSKIPYVAILVGTVIIVSLYYSRIYGIPVPFTNIEIVDYSEDWRDVVTKICQQIMVIPIALILGRKIYEDTFVPITQIPNWKDYDK